jgi:gelsolin
MHLYLVLFQTYLLQLFRSYFDYKLTYLEGGVDSGFTHVEAAVDKPTLYKIKGTQNGLSMTQVSLTKTSLNGGDSFILKINASTVWVWHGAAANPDEKAKANAVSEKMCTRGTSVVLDQGAGDEEDGAFWGHLGTDGEIGDAEEGDEEIEEFTPLVFQVSGGGDVSQVAKAETMKHFGKPVAKFDKGLLEKDNVYLLDAGWDIFLWIGSGSDKTEKLAGMSKADTYMVGGVVACLVDGYCRTTIEFSRVACLCVFCNVCRRKILARSICP